MALSRNSSYAAEIIGIVYNEALLIMSLERTRSDKNVFLRGF